jgi:hypothetical protein
MRAFRFLRRTFVVLAGVLFVTWASLSAALAQDGPDYVGRRNPVTPPDVSSGGWGIGTLPTTGLAIAALVALAIAFIVIGRILRNGADDVPASTA